MSPTTLVLSGGGIRGIATLGALQYLIDHNHITIEQFNTFIGTSIGSVLSVLLIIGYSPSKIYEIMYRIDLSDFAFYIDAYNFYHKFGFDIPNRIIILIERLLKYKNIDTSITLEQFYQKFNKDLIMTTINLSNYKGIYLSHIHYPNLSLIEALKMTTAIPFIFEPVIYKNEFYIDGGLFDNYPIQLKEDSIGIILVEKSIDVPMKDFSLFSYVKHVFNFSIFKNVYYKAKQFSDKTILIEFDKIITTEAYKFDIDNDSKKQWYEFGFYKAEEFILKKHKKKIIESINNYSKS